MKSNRKISILVICAVIFAFSTNAQTPYRQFGIKAGMNISNVTSNISNYSSKDFVGGNLSLTFDRVHFRFLTFGGEFNMVQRGFSNSLNIIDSLGSSLGVATVRNKFNYFSVPLKLGVQFGNRLYIFGNAAFVPAYLLRASSRVPVLDVNGLVTNYTWQDANSAAQFELSTQIELGIGVTKAKRYKFYVSAAKQQALTNLFNDPQSSFNLKSTGIIISTGMKVEFGKGLFR